MGKLGQALSTPGARKPWIGFGLIGLVAVTAGVILPQLMPAAAPAEKAPTAPAKDAGDLSYTPPSWPEGPSPGQMLTRLGLGTAVVLALAVGTIWVSKRWLAGPPGGAAGTAHLRLVETLPLGNRCCVHLVHVGSQQILVGVDGSGMKSLLPLPEPFDRALNEAQGEPSPADPPAAGPRAGDAWPYPVPGGRAR